MLNTLKKTSAPTNHFQSDRTPPWGGVRGQRRSLRRIPRGPARPLLLHPSSLPPRKGEGLADQQPEHVWALRGSRTAKAISLATSRPQSRGIRSVEALPPRL